MEIKVKCVACPVYIVGEASSYEAPLESADRVFRLNGTEWTCPECGSGMYEVSAA